MKYKLEIILVVMILIMFFGCNSSEGWIMLKKELNMANTVGPIIDHIARDLCNYKNIQHGTPAKGGSLIYKREPVETCISGIGNVYYIRCYEWGYEGTKLWHKPICDKPIGCYSCIDEEDVNIPFWDEELQNAELGVKYYVKTRR